MEICTQRLAHVRGQWQALTTSLGANNDFAAPPVNVVELELCDLQRAQAQPRKHGDHCEISSADDTISIAAGK